MIMIKTNHSLVRASLLTAIIFSSLANAESIVYEGSIGLADNPLGTVSGLVDGSGWIDSDASNIDFWSFSVGAGGLAVDVWATRTDSAFDPAFSLYSGITSADEITFKNFGSFAELTYLKSADDDISQPPELNLGPFADPALFDIYLSEGSYTIAIGGYENGDVGPYGYDLFIANAGEAISVYGVVPAVPELSTWVMMSFGLAGIGLMVRRKQKTTEM